MATMNGIDISKYQSGINLNVVPADFVIIKATQGTSTVNSECDKMYQQAKKAGKLLGVYHYATGKGAVAEADFFLKNVKNYIGEAILVLDWETDGGVGKNTAFNSVTYAKQWLDRVYQKTGVRPIIYMSKSVCRQFVWSSVAANYGLWVAQYASSDKTGYKSNPWTDAKGYGAWKSPVLFQYTANGRLSGYNGDLDLDIAYIDKAAWAKYAKGTTTKVVTETVVVKDEKKPAATPAKKTIAEVAQEVVDGKWGNDPVRDGKLKAAGYDADKVQAKVNEIMAAKKKAAAATPAKTYYTIKKGDTLTDIAKKYGTTVKQLQTWNGITNANKIVAGNKIRVK